MNARHCAAIGARLPLFVGDDLGSAELAAVRAHLRDCSTCRREASALLQTRRQLAKAAELRLPAVDDSMFAAMHANVLAQVDGEMVAARDTFAGPDRAWRRRAAVGAVAALLFLCGWLAGRPETGLLHRRPIQRSGGDAIEASSEWRSPILQPLGHRDGAGMLPPAGGPGFMGRLSLRTLEDEQAGGIDDPLTPAPVATPRREPGAGAASGR